MIEGLFPLSVAAVGMYHDRGRPAQVPTEERLVDHACRERREEFGTGRRGRPAAGRLLTRAVSGPRCSGPLSGGWGLR